MAYPKVTIIILNFNGLLDTRICLEKLLKTSYKKITIIVVDNGSTTNEADILRKEFKQKNIKILRFNKNYGFSGGNNKILKKINEKYVVLVNNDVEVTPNWLTPLVEYMEKHTQVGVLQPKILWQKNKKYFDYSGACGGFIDIFGYPFTRGRIFNTQEKDNGQYDTIREIFWTSGATMLIRMNILKKVGYFDESFFNYMEEIDLCYRIQLAGFKAICFPQSIVYHKVASTASRNAEKKRFWEHRNNLMLILKNYPVTLLIFIFPLRIILEYISIIYYVLIGKPIYAFSVIKSQFSLIYFIPEIVSFRQKRVHLFKNFVWNKIYLHSIIIQYFIFKKRFFSRLNYN